MRRRSIWITALALPLLVGCGSSEAPTTSTGEASLGLAAADAARTCLEGAGIAVTAGKRSPGDRNAPDVELILNGRPPGAFIGFYRTAARARRYLPMLERNAAGFHGAVEHHGTASIVWVKPPPHDAQEQVDSCAFGALGARRLAALQRGLLIEVNAPPGWVTEDGVARPLGSGHYKPVVFSHLLSPTGPGEKARRTGEAVVVTCAKQGAPQAPAASTVGSRSVSGFDCTVTARAPQQRLQVTRQVAREILTSLDVTSHPSVNQLVKPSRSVG